jgi:hypothetical protein
MRWWLAVMHCGVMVCHGQDECDGSVCCPHLPRAHMRLALCMNSCLAHAQPCASGDTITRNALSLALTLVTRTHTLSLTLSLFQCSDHTNRSLKPLKPLTRSLAYVAYRHCPLTMCTTRTAAAPPSCRVMPLCKTHSLTHTSTQTSTHPPTHPHSLTRSQCPAAPLPHRHRAEQDDAAGPNRENSRLDHARDCRPCSRYCRHSC